MLEFTLIILIAVSLMLTASSRLLHSIRLIAIQGVALGILPFAVNAVNLLPIHGETIFISLLNIAIKAVILPLLLIRTMHKSGIQRELEPIAGYSVSVLAVLLCGAGAMWLGGNLVRVISQMVIPAAVMTMAAGLLLIVARKKAITQVIGFLSFENGITVFGIGMQLEYGLFVELGILLDVVVLIFIMGIAVFQIRREFSHIDTDRLNTLNETTQEK